MRAHPSARVGLWSVLTRTAVVPPAALHRVHRRDPAYLTRAWCLFELYTAITEAQRVKIDVVLTEAEDASFLKAMATQGCELRIALVHRRRHQPCGTAVVHAVQRVAQASQRPPISRVFAAPDSCIDVALHSVNSSLATATQPADLAAIRSLVTSLPGSFATLDATVKQHLHRSVLRAASALPLRGVHGSKAWNVAAVPLS